MADKTETVTLNKDAGSPDETVIRKWVDQGDGTHAEKVAAELVVGDVTVGMVDQGAAGAEDWKVTLDGEPLSADENVIGLVGASDEVVSVTPTLDTSAYAGGDLLFDSTEVANAARVNGGKTMLVSVTLIDKADQKAPITLLFANANTDFGTPNSAPNPDDTEVATVIGFTKIVATDYVDLGGASVACKTAVALQLKAGAATTSIYVAGIYDGTGTPQYAASDLVIQLGFLRG